MDLWWAANRDNVGAIAAIVSAVGVLLWILVTVSTQRQIQTSLEAQAQTLAELKRGEKNMGEITSSLKLLKRAQCSSPYIQQNTPMSAALGCTANSRLPTTRLSPPSQDAPPSPAANAIEVEPFMPNYGYFGPFGTATSASKLSMF